MRYDGYLHESSATVFTIFSTVKQAKFHLSDIIMTLSLFIQLLFILHLTCTVKVHASWRVNNIEKPSNYSKNRADEHKFHLRTHTCMMNTMVIDWCRYLMNLWHDCDFLLMKKRAVRLSVKWRQLAVSALYSGRYDVILRIVTSQKQWRQQASTVWTNTCGVT